MKKTLDQLNGVDVSEYQPLELNKQAFKEVDFELYPPLRMHFLVHALQFQQRLPSQASMLRSERRNLRKSGEDEANKKMSRVPKINNPKRARRAFILPSKIGPQPPKRIRRNINFFKKHSTKITSQMFKSKAASFPVGGNPSTVASTTASIGLCPFLTGMPGIRPFPLGMPPMGSMPFSMGMPPMGSMPPSMGMPPIGSMPPLGSMLPMGLMSPSMGSIPASVGLIPPSMGSIPPSVGSIPPAMGIPSLGSMTPFGRPSMTIPMGFPSGFPMPSLSFHSAPPSKGKAPKPKSTVFKVRSPEQIVLKNARTTCRQQVQKWRGDKSVVISEEVNKQVPVYFQKKKASQKRRRQEKHQLIKKNRKRLVQIFGNSVFRTGWPISRKQIKEALGIKEEVQSEEQFQGIALLLQGEQEQSKIEIIQQDQVEIEQTTTEVVSNSKDQQVKLVLLVEGERKECVTLQYVLTG